MVLRTARILMDSIDTPGNLSDVARAYTFVVLFFFSSRRRHTRCLSDWSSDVCSSDLFYVTNSAAVTSVTVNYTTPAGVTKPGIIVLEISGAVSSGVADGSVNNQAASTTRSEERRVGKECRSRWSRDN